jgi:hypothetical protein
MLQEFDRALHPPANSLVPPAPFACGSRHRRKRAAVHPQDEPHAVPQTEADIDLDDLVFRVVAAFRRHPHVNNVLTHIARADWRAVEQAIRAILDPCSLARDLSPLACNIVDLMCADRGVTGRILKPYYQDLLRIVLGEPVAARFIAHVGCLYFDCEAAARAAVAAKPNSAVLPQVTEAA